MACIRSGNVELTKSVIAKAIQSAKAGFQTLLLLEHGKDEKDQAMKTGTTSISANDREFVRVQHVIAYPPNQLMWTSSCGWSGEWKQDQTGAFQSCEAEGKASKQRSVHGKAVGFNVNRVDAWLYAPAPAPLMKTSEEAFRELVKVVANTTSPFPAIGQRSICKMNKDFLTKAITLSAEPSFMELRYEALVSSSTLDTMALAAKLGWQPYGDIDRKLCDFMPDAAAGSPSALLQEIRRNTEEDESDEEEVDVDIETVEAN
jgi:hypothetical protein